MDGSDCSHHSGRRDSDPWPAEGIETPQVRLGPLSPADIDEMIAAVPAGDCGPWGPLPGPLDRETAGRFVADCESARQTGERLAWTARELPDDRFVGGIVLLRSGPSEAEIGYWIAPPARGRGLATTVLALAADHALGRLCLDRVWLEISPENRPSRRVAETAGFTLADVNAADPRHPRGSEEPDPSSDAGDAQTRTARGGDRHDVLIHERRRLRPLPPGYRLRPPRLQDAATVAALRTACEIHDEGEATTDAAELAADWRCLPRFDLEKDAWVIEAVSGDANETAPAGIVAFAWLQDEEEHRVLVGEYSIHPDARGRGLDAVLMDRIEARARQHAALTPEREATHDVFAPVACADKLALFAARGYHKVREFARMHIDLTEAVRLPSWPDALTVRAFRRGQDEAAVHDAMDEAFREHFRATSMSLTDWCGFLYGNPRFDPGLWTVAWDGGQVVGTCLGYYYPDRRSGYIDELGVLPAWRRRGLGSALLLATLASLRERGARNAVLGVDTRNVTGALHVYEAAGWTRRLLTHVYTKRVPAPLREP